MTKLEKEKEKEEKRRAEEAAAASSSSTESDIPLAEVVAREKAGRASSPSPAVELAEALPLVPRGHRVVRKRKETAANTAT